MRRPGYLSGYEGLVPRAHRRALGNQRRMRRRLGGFGGYGRLGAFGKGYAVGPPPPPNAPLAPPKTVRQDNALNRQTNSWYMQDIRCAPGEKLWQRTEPCSGADCDPGEIEKYSECDDDPAFWELPDDDFPDCDTRAKAGWPGACTKQNCPSCFMPKPQPQQQTIVMGPMLTMPPGGMPPMPRGRKGEEEEEFERELEEMESATEKMEVEPPPVAIEPIYRGGPMPIVPSRAVNRGGPTAESKIAKMVEAYEEKKLATAYRSPARTFIVQSGGSGGGGPRRGPGRGPARSPRPEGPSAPIVTPARRGILNWIRETLFG